ncbi:polyketide synthase [Pseudonocardia sp. SCN 73-27]|uniref:polyketide synthase n=1 Tax=Pseudonocardia sp. SCN 73-27 TaxID=1660132 RepID=UPI000B0A7EDF|nr:polyketide synthase [Pseudonocardia sp. SCN 73-27]
MTAAVANDSFAVVGLGLRVPGATDIDSFWDTIVEGRPVTRSIDASELCGYDLELVGPGGLTAALLDDGGDFDAAFFDLNPRLAAWMDPQQGLLLETAWHALEDASIPPSSIRGGRTGVFVASATMDFRDSLVRAGVLDKYAMHADGTFLSNRLSYQLDARGPSLNINTACSGGLSALSVACGYLAAGLIDTAIVGAVNLCTDGWISSALAALGALSPSGTARPFSPDASGYVRGEGAITVVVRRLADARRLGDPMRAVVRSVSVSHDGRQGGPVRTDMHSQEALLQEAYGASGIAACAVGYIEAHAPGTRLDVNELEALSRFVCSTALASRSTDTAPGDALLVGSLKNVFGHLEGAAGSISLAKAMLVVQHGVIPAGSGLVSIAPTGERTIRPSRAGELIPWPQGRPRIAGVSSFGIGGSNAHVVIEGAPTSGATQRAVPRSQLNLPLSARTPSGLRHVAEDALAGLSGVTDTEAFALIWSYQTGRDRHSCRAVVHGASTPELISDLRRLIAGPEHPAADSDWENPSLSARLWLAGEETDWAQDWSVTPSYRASLPPSPFDRAPHAQRPQRQGGPGAGMAQRGTDA